MESGYGLINQLNDQVLDMEHFDDRRIPKGLSVQMYILVTVKFRNGNSGAAILQTPDKINKNLMIDRLESFSRI